MGYMLETKSNLKMKRIVEHLIVVSLFGIITLLLCYPLLSDMKGHIGKNLGDPLLNVWILGWDIHSFLHGNFSNIFDANIFYPYPGTLTFSENLFGTALLGLPVFLLTKNIIITYNVLFIIGFILTGWAGYLFVKELLPYRIAAFMGGIIFTFNPWRFNHIPQIQIITAWWIPLCFWALIRYHRTRALKYLIGFLIFFVLNSVSNAHYMLFMVVAVIIYEVCMFLLSSVKKPQMNMPGRRSIKWIHLMITALIIILPILLVYMPYYRMSRLLNITRTTEEVTQFSSSAGELVTISADNSIMGKFTEWNGSIIFSGIVLGALLLWGLSILIRERSSEFKRIITAMSAVGLSAFLFSLGPVLGHIGGLAIPGPYALLRIFPGFSSIRAPSRFAVFVYLVMGLLVALILSKLEQKISSSRIIGIVVIIIVVGLVFITYPLRFVQVPYQGNCPPVYQWLAKQAEGPVMELPVLVEVAPKYNYFSTFHWKKVFNGYSGFSPPLYTYARKASAVEQVALARAAGIRYYIVHKLFCTDILRQSLMTSLVEAGFKKVFENADAVVFLDDRAQGLPLFTLRREELTAGEIQVLPGNSNVKISVKYHGKKAIVLYPLKATLKWYLNGKIIKQEKVMTRIIPPMISPGEQFGISSTSPASAGLYLLHIDFPNDVHLTQSIKITATALSVDTSP